MTKPSHKVTFFAPYAFHLGQKIRITGSRRRGDWEVIGVDEHKVQLRCPVSGRQVEWERFCYLVREEENAPWPQED